MIILALHCCCIFYFSSPGSILFVVLLFPNKDAFCSCAESDLDFDIDMCGKQDCQLKHLLAVLVLAAAVARVHGKGKDLTGGYAHFCARCSVYFFLLSNYSR